MPPYIIPESKVPKGSYNTVMYHDHIVMMGMTQSGISLICTDTGECITATFEDIVELVIESPDKKPLPEPEETDQKKVRKIEKPS